MRQVSFLVLLLIMTLAVCSSADADIWEFGGVNTKTDGDDLYAFNMDILQDYDGDIFLSDHAFQIAGPYMGQSHEVWTWGSSSAPTYDDGFVRIENIRHVDQSSLHITKFSDHVHYHFRIEAWTFHAGHLWFKIFVLGRKLNVGVISSVVTTILEQ